MARIPASYVCDKCKVNTDWLPRVFHDIECDSQRLCRVCWEKFLEQYKLWCNDPQPANRLPEPKTLWNGLFRKQKG